MCHTVDCAFSLYLVMTLFKGNWNKFGATRQQNLHSYKFYHNYRSSLLAITHFSARNVHSDISGALK